MVNDTFFFPFSSGIFKEEYRGLFSQTFACDKPPSIHISQHKNYALSFILFFSPHSVKLTLAQHAVFPKYSDDFGIFWSLSKVVPSPCRVILCLFTS